MHEKTLMTELLNSDESSFAVEEAYPYPVEAASPPMMVASPLPVVVAPPPLSEGISPVLPEKTLIASPGAAAMQEKADSPQESPPSPPFASRLKSHQAPKGEIKNVTHEELYYTPKKLLKFSNLHRQKTREHVWKWLLRVWNNGGRNIKLSQDKFIDIDSPSRDSAFNVAAQGGRQGSNSLVGWLVGSLTETWIKSCPQ